MKKSRQKLPAFVVSRFSPDLAQLGGLLVLDDGRVSGEGLDDEGQVGVHVPRVVGAEHVVPVLVVHEHLRAGLVWLPHRQRATLAPLSMQLAEPRVLVPIGVFLQVGFCMHFWINILLTLLGYIPGILHAVWIIAKK